MSNSLFGKTFNKEKKTRNGHVAKNKLGRHVKNGNLAVPETKVWHWEFKSDEFEESAIKLCQCSNHKENGTSKVCLLNFALAIRATETKGRGVSAEPFLHKLYQGFKASSDDEALQAANSLMSVYGCLDFLLALVGEADFQRDIANQLTRFAEPGYCAYAILLLEYLSKCTTPDAATQFQLHPFLAFDLGLAGGRLGDVVAAGDPDLDVIQGTGEPLMRTADVLDSCRRTLLNVARAGAKPREAVRRGLCWAYRASLFEYADGTRSQAEQEALADVRAELEVTADPSMDLQWADDPTAYGHDLQGIGSNQGSLALACFITETRRVTRSAMCAWLCSASLSWPSPEQMHVYTPQEQEHRYRSCAELNAKAKVAGKSDAKKFNQKMTALVLNVNESFIQRMIKGHVFEQSRRYSEDANAMDPDLTPMQEFQAGRNVWACMGLQLVLLRCKVECHAAVLGYSMLYPYTDNYLDDASVSKADKKEFQVTFRQWLKGEWDTARAPQTPLEHKIAHQVRLIESRWPRAEHPGVYCSLVSIHDGQSRSMLQHTALEKAEYTDILDISADKGGTSVLADLYITHGDHPERWHAAYAMNLGVALQFVDDIQDIEEDIEDGNQTLFSVPSAARSLPADRSARRLCNYICEVLRPNSYGFDKDAETLEDRVSVGELMQGKVAMCFSIALKAVARAQPSFTPEFLKEAECRCPLPLRGMAKLAGMKSLLTIVKQDKI